MSEVDRRLDALIEAVKCSPEYLHYCEYREEIKKYPEKMSLINEFRMRNFKLQNTKANIDMYDETDKLDKEFVELSKDEIMGEYLQAEVALCRSIQNINWKIIRELDFEIELEG